MSCERTETLLLLHSVGNGIKKKKVFLLLHSVMGSVEVLYREALHSLDCSHWGRWTKRLFTLHTVRIGIDGQGITHLLVRDSFMVRSTLPFFFSLT